MLPFELCLKGLEILLCFLFVYITMFTAVHSSISFEIVELWNLLKNNDMISVQHIWFVNIKKISLILLNISFKNSSSYLGEMYLVIRTIITKVSLVLHIHNCNGIAAHHAQPQVEK